MIHVVLLALVRFLITSETMTVIMLHIDYYFACDVKLVQV